MRATLLSLGVNKGVPFLSDILDGKVRVDLIGKCANCGAETQADATWLEESATILKASVEQRMRAVEQTWKYGLGTQKDVEVSVSSIRERVQETLQVIQRHAPPDLAARIISALQPVWT